MPNDKTKIITEAGDLYIAATGETLESSNDLTNWQPVGWCEGGSIRLTVSERNEIELHKDNKFKLSLGFLFEAMGLETDLAKITALEALQSDIVDIAIVINPDVPSGFVGYRFDKLSLNVEPEFQFSLKVPRKVKIEGTRTAKNLSEIQATVNYPGNPP